MITPTPFLYVYFFCLLFYVSHGSVSISVSHKLLSKSGDPITIRWSGVDSPSKLDWLGIYSPSNSSHENFIGYIFLSTSIGWRSGSGSLTFPVVNLRSKYQFRIFHWTKSEVDVTRLDNDHNPLPGTKKLLAESEEIEFEPGCGPEQVHLALTGKDGEMRVMFVTHDGEESFVRYGLTRREMGRVVGTRVSRYEREDMCDSPANESVGWRDPGFIHDGVMINLEIGKRYYYQVGSDPGGWSVKFSFISQNLDSDETVAFMLGDMGTAAPYKTFDRTQGESLSTIRWIKRDIESFGNKPMMISHIGDISYARGYSWLWDTFFTQIEPIASRVPYHVCIGNHEYNWPLQPWKPKWASSVYKKDSGGECGVPYSLRFNMPGNDSELTGMKAPETRNLYYSFDMGVVHFVYLSTETNFLPGSKQYEFLKRDLGTTDRRKTPFVVVQGHRPMYTTANKNREAGLRARMIEHLEPLLVKNKVSLVLWGHVHRYERFCPLNNFSCGELDKNRDAEWLAFPVHVVIGMAGQDSQPLWETRVGHPDDPIFPQPVRSLYRSGEFGYTRLVATREKLGLYYVGNHDGEVHDAVEIAAPPGEVVRSGGGETVMGRWSEFISLSWHADLSSRILFLVLIGLIGYVIGKMSYGGRHGFVDKNWSPLKNEVV
ncbi:probable inactive purple acid phosphatase 2 [Primulina eburnea]|uniref:probable inactive purple acid phosphatase 2 n=1 Tax=Primulina eburnea TaxID=1245227 RepID=UPI003C6C8237